MSKMAGFSSNNSFSKKIIVYGMDGKLITGTITTTRCFVLKSGWWPLWCHMSKMASQMTTVLHMPLYYITLHWFRQCVKKKHKEIHVKRDLWIHFWRNYRFLLWCLYFMFNCWVVLLVNIKCFNNGS